MAREDGHRLYFRAIFAGAILFALMLFARYHAIQWSPWYARVESQMKAVLESLAKDANAAKAVSESAIACFYAMLVAYPIAWLLNLFFWNRTWLRRSIKNDDFEALLLRALEGESALAVSMEDGKVYVGFVVNAFDPLVARKTFSILPLMSGYRHHDTRQIEFTTFYTQIYGSPANAGAKLPAPLEHLRPKDFVTVLPVDGVVSSRLFDFNAYLAFHKQLDDEDRTG